MILLAPFALVYSALMIFRAWCYRVGVLPSESSGAFVISIGNIQAGGTGKTPMVDFFARRWRNKIRVGIVSRGYGRKSTGSHRVDPNDVDAAEKFGDEATWLARSLENVPVQVGEKRVRAAQDLIVSEGVTSILLDDGFQHSALRRSFDIVLIDVSAPAWHWRPIPWGRLREPVGSLRRADFIILTKTESVPTEKVDEVEKHVRYWAGENRTTFDGRAAKLRIVQFRQKVSWPKLSAEPLVLAAGLARPEAFFAMVLSHESKPNVVATISFPDHHDFTVDDVLRLKRAALEKRSNRVLVTEKDAVKLSGIWSTVDGEGRVDLVVSKLEVLPARESDEVELEHVDEVILGEVRRLPRPSTQFPRSKSAD